MAEMNSETLLKSDYLLQENLLSPTTYNLACLCPSPCQLLDPPLLVLIELQAMFIRL